MHSQQGSGDDPRPQRKGIQMSTAVLGHEIRGKLFQWQNTDRF